MNIDNHKVLIANLPVRQQSFTTKQTTWLNAEAEVDWLSDFNHRLFGGKESLTISRQDIFNSNDSIRELIVMTIYWGYPRGMRGNNFVNILRNIEMLELTLANIKSKQD